MTTTPDLALTASGDLTLTDPAEVGERDLTDPTEREPLAGEDRLHEMAQAADADAAQYDSDAALHRLQAEKIEERAVEARRHAVAYRLALDYLRGTR